MLELVDHFGANFVIYIMATIEVRSTNILEICCIITCTCNLFYFSKVMAIAWVYGLTSFIRDIEFMLGVKIGWYWKFCWGFFVPCGLSGIFIYAMATETRLTYNGWGYPDSAVGMNA